MSRALPRWLLTTLRLAPALVLATVGSVAGLVVVRALVPMELLDRTSDAIGTYLQTVGGIYAVLLAFVVYVVWGQFNDARSLVQREAASLVDLHRTVCGLPRESRTAIHAGLRIYIEAVLDQEWHAMARHDQKAIEKIGMILDGVWLAIHRCQPCSACQHTVYSEVLSRFNDLTDLRTNRLITAEFRIPLAMKILLYNGAVIVIGSMYLLAIHQLWLHALVTAAMAGAVAHVLYLIADLDDAFSGDWQVARAPFEGARTAFDRTTHLVSTELDGGIDAVVLG
jgi:Protein of unknown function (DUF4239)